MSASERHCVRILESRLKMGSAVRAQMPYGMLLKSLCVIAALSGVLAQPAQAQERQAQAGRDDLVPSCNFPNAACGYVDARGRTVIAPQYDWADKFAGDRARVARADKLGFIDPSGRAVVPLKYDLAGPFRLGFAEVFVGDRVGLIDTSGDEVFAPQFGRIIPLSAERFLVAPAPFRIAPGFRLMDEPFALDRIEPLPPAESVTGTWGIMDRAGRWIVEPRFDHVALFSRHDRQLFWAKRGTKWQLMRADGEAVTEALFDQVCPSQEGRARVVVAWKWGLIDDEGRMVIEPTYDFIAPFRDGLAVVRRDHKEGAVDRDGRVVISVVFDRVEPVEDGRLRARGHLDLWIDRTGRVTGVDECADGRRVAHRVDGNQIVDRSGHPINPALFSYIRFACDAPSLVRTGERSWNFIDAGGKLLRDRDFDVAYPFGRGLAVGLVGHAMQIIDERGTVLMETPEFAQRLSIDYDGGGVQLIVDHGTERDEMFVPLDPAKVVELAHDPTQLSAPVERMACGEGVAASRHHGKWGFQDVRGTLFIAPRFDEVGCFRRGLAWAAMPERREWCLIDKRGALVTSHACVCGQPLMRIYPEPPADGRDCYDRGRLMIGGAR
jgi:hypothetical protein